MNNKFLTHYLLVIFAAASLVTCSSILPMQQRGLIGASKLLYSIRNFCNGPQAPEPVFFSKLEINPNETSAEELQRLYKTFKADINVQIDHYDASYYTYNQSPCTVATDQMEASTRIAQTCIQFLTAIDKAKRAEKPNIPKPSQNESNQNIQKAANPSRSSDKDNEYF